MKDKDFVKKCVFLEFNWTGRGAGDIIEKNYLKRRTQIHE